jgi:hypothetical protein
MPGNTQTYGINQGGGGRRKERKPKSPPADQKPAYYDFDSFEEATTSLKQGLVGGVKPLNVAIPETGKLLLLTAVLPPEQVGVELEVKARKR